MDDFDAMVQADEFEDPFDALDDEDFDWLYADDEDDDPDVDDSFPMYLEYEGPFGLSGYDDY